LLKIKSFKQKKKIKIIFELIKVVFAYLQHWQKEGLYFPKAFLYPVISLCDI
jgi:hypothetical protein